MGLFQMIFGEAQVPVEPVPQPDLKAGTGGKGDANLQAYENDDPYFDHYGRLRNYDYKWLLMHKQQMIQQLFELAYYYRDADPIVHGIIYHVYVPYTLSSPWQLRGPEKTNKIYEAYYDKIHLADRLQDIVVELATYNNVVVYFLNGVPMTMPINRCRIGSLRVNGEPLVEFNCQAVLDEYTAQGYLVRKGWIDDSNPEMRRLAYPPEVIDALNECKPWVQLNPKYCFVLQGPKDGWTKWAVPWISAALLALQQKEVIRKYETAILNLGIHSFVHTQYGGTTKERDIIPDNVALNSIHSIFRRAMSGFPLVTTSHLAKAYVVQPDMDDLFQWDKYKQVNNDIFSAGGISGVIATGVSSDGATFSSAQVSMQTAENRIEAFRRLLCGLMNKLNVCIKEKLSESHLYNVREVPVFTFMPLEMAGRKAMREACADLWSKGLVSTDTYMHLEGYDMEREAEKRKHEADIGIEEVLTPRVTNVQQTMNESGDEGGRPEMDDDERHSDPEASDRGAQPKPSTSTA